MSACNSLSSACVKGVYVAASPYKISRTKSSKAPLMISLCAPHAKDGARMPEAGHLEKPAPKCASKSRCRRCCDMPC
eukprot:4041492-Alexandrium_andersonii.AAC.1